MKNNILRYGFSAIIWLMLTLPALAGPEDPPTDDDPMEPGAPIDNGIWLLVFLALLIAAYGISRKNKKSIAG